MQRAPDPLRYVVIGLNVVSSVVVLYGWVDWGFLGSYALVTGQLPLAAVLFAPVLILVACVVASSRLLRHGGPGAMVVAVLTLLGGTVWVLYGAKTINRAIG